MKIGCATEQMKTVLSHVCTQQRCLHALRCAAVLVQRHELQVETPHTMGTA